MTDPVASSAARRRVLELLLHSPEPVTADAVAERLGLHVTTARFHLDRLVASRLVIRRAAAERRRGRPRLLYAPGDRARHRDVRDQMIGVLAAALADHGGDAARAGGHWAASFAPLDPADPAGGLTDLLDELGFEPERTGHEVRLRACPFRSVAREHPDVICTVHRELIARLLAGHALDAELEAFATPDTCVVRLGRSAA